MLTFCRTLHLRYLTGFWIHLWGRPDRPSILLLSESIAKKCNPVIVVRNFKRDKYCILEMFHLTFHWVANEPFLSDSRAIFLSSFTGEPLLKFHVLKWTVIKFKCFFILFQTFFVFTIKWRDITSSIHQKLLWKLSMNVMQGLLV